MKKLLTVTLVFVCLTSCGQEYKKPEKIIIKNNAGADTVDWKRLFPPPDTSYKKEGMTIDHFWYFVAYDSRFGEVLNIDSNGKLNILKDSLTAIQILLKSYLELSDLYKERKRDTVYIYQEIFQSAAEYALLTNDGSLYDNVVHGTLEYATAQKPIEFRKALARRKPIAIVTAKCKL